MFEVAALFFRLGCTAFGGPAAHAALFEQELVNRLGWLSREEFLDRLSVTNLIPGPNSTELAMLCGRVRAGNSGLLAAGFAFILPAVLLTALFGYLGVTYGRLPALQPYLQAVQAAVVGIILHAAWQLGRKAVSNLQQAGLAAAVFLAALAGFSEIALLFIAGGIGLVLSLRVRQLSALSPLLLFQFAGGTTSIFFKFFKIGALLYGSGYVLFAFLEAELAAPGLLSREQILEAVAVGQFTPGPVLSTATYIGWQLGGWSGALAATAGIFLPSFIYTMLLAPVLPRLRKSLYMNYFLNSINLAAVALIAAVGIKTGRTVFELNPWLLFISISAIVVLYIFPKLNTIWIILGAVSLGALSYFF